jgi:hypothetical protein
LAANPSVDVWFKAISGMEGMYSKDPGPAIAVLSLQPAGGQASSPDLAKLFSTGDKSRIEQAVRHMDENWTYYRPHLLTDVKRWEGRRLLYAGRRRTKLGELLADTCWLTDKGGTPRRPSELFLDTPRTREVLGDDVPYLAIQFRDERIGEDLGIQQGPTVEAALARLRSLAARQVVDVDVTRTLYGA